MIIGKVYEDKSNPNRKIIITDIERIFHYRTLDTSHHFQIKEKALYEIYQEAEEKYNLTLDQILELGQILLNSKCDDDYKRKRDNYLTKIYANKP